jgi:hypothetical protein
LSAASLLLRFAPTELEMISARSEAVVVRAPRSRTEAGSKSEAASAVKVAYDLNSV